MIVGLVVGGFTVGIAIATDSVPSAVIKVLPDQLQPDGDQGSEVTDLRRELSQSQERISELESELEAARSDAEESQLDQSQTTQGQTSQYLADMDEVDCEGAGCPSFGLTSGRAEIAGDIFPQSIGFSQREDRGSVTYTLGKDFTRFQALVGLSEDSENGASARVQFYLDDVLKREVEVSATETAEINLDTTDMLRLRIESIPLSDSSLMTTMIGDGRLSTD